MKPLVSIIILAYNHEKYIGDCLESFIAQSYKNLEMMIIDDCSEDKTYSIIESYKEKMEAVFNSVKIQRNMQNLGAVKSLNSMLKIAQGVYVKYFDGDDMILENSLEIMVDTLQKNSQIAMVHGNVCFCSQDEHYPLKNYKINTEKKQTDDRVDCNFQTLLEYDYILSPTVLFRNEIIKKIGVFDEKIVAADWDYWLRIAHDNKFKYIPEELVAYRILPHSMSHFTKDEEGRKRFRQMFQSQESTIIKYKEDEKVKWDKVMRSFITRNLHCAIDLQDNVMIKKIKYMQKKEKVIIGVEINLKYIMYRMHLLSYIQCVKRKLGMQTANV